MLITSPQVGGALPPLPASTGFVVVDRHGMAVTCVVTMDNLFGTGRVVPGLGILLAASPTDGHLPLLASALAYNPNLDAFRAAVAGTGQEAASFATAVGMAQLLGQTAGAPVSVAEPGRVEAIGCGRYLPGTPGSCSWSTDPKGAGLALGGD